MSSTQNCPLCGLSEHRHYHSDKKRDYLQCSRCELVFTPANFYLSPEQERAEYEKHENSSADLGYRRFLSRLSAPLSNRLTSGASGLDFGCGPGPALADMMAEQGFTMENYDPFFANKPKLLSKQYDFVCATEVVEHLHQPQQVFEQLFKCLKPNGLLGIMTKRVISQAAFSRWHYKNDPTHVCFYSVASFEFIADKFKAKLSIEGDDVVIFKAGAEH